MLPTARILGEFHLGILLSLPRDADLRLQMLQQLTASTQGGRLELETGCLLLCQAAGAVSPALWSVWCCFTDNFAHCRF